MRSHLVRRFAVLTPVLALAAAALVAGPPVSAAPAAPSVPHPPGSSGHLIATAAHQVVLADLPDVAPSRTATTVRAPLLLNGHPSTANRPSIAARKPGGFAPAVTTPTTVLQNFAGTGLAQSSCGCQPPDSNAAMSNSQIVEGTNLALSVFRKNAGGSLIKRTSFANFLGTTDSLSDPRVLWDNTWQRFFLTVIVVPANATAAPAIWFAISRTSNAAGAWWIYRAAFGGGPYTPGTLMDYPMVGMDADAVIVSTNLFGPTGSFTTGSLFALPKGRIYNGLGFGVGAFNTEFSSHPAVVEGIPQNLDGREYVVASRIPFGETGLHVYYLTNTGRPDSTTYTFVGNATDAHGSTPPNPAQQPGTGHPALDTLDGRLQAAPHQLNGQLWFARAEGFPLVEYGAINASTLAVNSAVAFDAGSSDDWNPSIAVSDAGGGNQYVFLNWAYTNPAGGVNVSTRVAGLTAGDAVQNLVGVGTTLATGGISTSESRFGDFSSVQVDSFASGVCGVGRSALVANQEFDSAGNWIMREARVGFC